MPDLTIDRARDVLETRAGGVLRRGAHKPPNGECRVCVRELRALCLGLPWTDAPDGPDSPTDTACTWLNDAAWSSDRARTDGCLPLVTLTDADAADGWVARYAELTIRHVLPPALRAAAWGLLDTPHAAALVDAAERCERDGDAEAATVAAGAARDAARHAAEAAAGAARDAAVAAARHAADAAAEAAAWAAKVAAEDVAGAAGDRVLTLAVDVLLAAHAGAPYPQEDGRG